MALSVPDERDAKDNGRYPRFLNGVGAVAMLVGLMGCLGYLFAERALLSYEPGLPRIALLTAVAFLFLGYGMLTYRPEPFKANLKPRHFPGLSLASLTVAMLIGGYCVGYYISMSGFNLGELMLLGRKGIIIPTLMTSSRILFASLACIMMTCWPQKNSLMAYAVGAMGLYILYTSLFALFGYTVESPLLYGYNISLPATITFFLMGMAVLVGSIPYEGILCPLVSKDKTSRNLSIASILLSLLIMVYGIGAIAANIRYLDLAAVSKTFTRMFVYAEMATVNMAIVTVVVSLRAVYYRNEAQSNAVREATIATALHNSESRFQRVIKGADVGMWDWSIQSKQLFWSHRTYELLELEYDGIEHSWKHIFKKISRPDRLRILFALRRVLIEDVPFREEFHFMTSSGKYRYCQAQGHVTERDEAGKALRISGTVMDITAEKNAEMALRNTRDRLNRVISGSNEGVWEWDAKTELLYGSKRLYEMLGLPPSEQAIPYQTFAALLDKEDLSNLTTTLLHVIQSGASFAEELRLAHASGDTHYFRLQGKPYWDEQGQLQGLSGMLIDITERKRIQESLARSEEHFRFVTNTVPALIWMTDTLHSTTFINKSWMDFTGQTFEEVLGFGWLDKVHPDDREKIRDQFIEAADQRKEVVLEYRLLRVDGEYRHMLDIGAPLLEKDGTFMGYTGYVADITARIQAETARVESETKFRTLAETSTALIWEVDADWRLVYRNPKLIEFMGRDEEGKPILDWTQVIHPAAFDGVKQQLEESARTGQEFNVEVPFFHRPSGEYRWLKTAGTPLYDAREVFRGMVGIAFDVNDLKLLQRDLERTAQKLVQSNQDLEQFAAVASHDLKAPVRKISLFGEQIAKEKDRLSVENQDALDRVLKATVSMQTLIEDLLYWSQVAHGEHAVELVDLNIVLEHVIANLKPSIQEKSAQITIGKLMVVNGDAAQLQQLFQNLVENALKYQPYTANCQAQPQIEVTATKVDEQFCEISVQDNGIGFRQEKAEEIFIPFKRLHGKTSPYPGTGIGLAICKRIVERHGGTITAQGEVGKGACFTVRLPLPETSPLPPVGTSGSQSTFL